jgi:hypothetical protein
MFADNAVVAVDGGGVENQWKEIVYYYPVLTMMVEYIVVDDDDDSLMSSVNQMQTLKRQYRFFSNQQNYVIRNKRKRTNHVYFREK